MIHESRIKAEYGSNAQVIRRGDSRWRNPDRVSPHSTETSGERGYLNPLSKMDQKLLQHSDPYRGFLEDVLESLPGAELEAMDEISVSDGRDVVRYVRKGDDWSRRSIARNAAL